jgi:hypothetical protein
VSDVPHTAAMAALRQLRKAAHGHADLDEMSLAVDRLEAPMDDLCRAWQQVCGVLIDHDSRVMTAERWGAVVSALSVLDVALGSFFGPSGWEPQAASTSKA